MAGPVEELILANVETSLAAITKANGFRTNVVFVRRQHANVFTVEALPACIIVHELADKTEKRLGMAPVLLKLSIIMAVQTEGDDWPTILEEFIADVDNKLREDVTRGGPAVVTFIQESAVYDEDEMGGTGVAAAQSIVEISYRTQYLDTDTPI